MHITSFASMLMIGIASNLDNGGVGVTYGLRNVKVSLLPNLVIAVISFLATWLSGLCGARLSVGLPPVLAAVIGAMVLIAVGMAVIVQPFVKHENVQYTNRLFAIFRNPEAADFNHNRQISIGESILLGFALAMNALAGGLDAGLTKLSLMDTGVCVAAFSFLLLWLGTILGSRIAKRNVGWQTSVMAGGLLILIGVHQLMH